MHRNNATLHTTRATEINELSVRDIAYNIHLGILFRNISVHTLPETPSSGRYDQTGSPGQYFRVTWCPPEVTCHKMCPEEFLRLVHFPRRSSCRRNILGDFPHWRKWTSEPASVEETKEIIYSNVFHPETTVVVGWALKKYYHVNALGT